MSNWNCAVARVEDVRRPQEEQEMNLNLAKPQIAIVLSPEEVIELKMTVQDDDAPAALDLLRRLRRRVVEVEQRHCGDPDRLPGQG